MMTVAHMGMFMHDELKGTEPHARMFPTGFYQSRSDFKGTIMSCVDLVYCDGADLAAPYSEWRGTLHTTVRAALERFGLVHEHKKGMPFTSHVRSRIW